MNSESLLSGILEPVFAIRTEDDLGVGDAEGVRQMIDWCARHGLNIFQTLPINETGRDHSPYNAISSLALEPSTVAVSPRHVPELTEAKFQELAPPSVLAELQQGPVNYAKSMALKHALLSAAFDDFTRNDLHHETARAADFDRFVQENAGWLHQYALFRALMEVNGDSPDWERWPEEHRAPLKAHAWMQSLPAAQAESVAGRYEYFCYVQWIAFSQWQAVKDYADQRGVLLMGDIPFGVARSSADVWANRDIFDLDWSGGAPPEKFFKVDRFTEKWGQNWGVPNYRWDILRQRDFDWWRARIENVRRHFHLYRIDHVLGFFRVYSFPWPPERNAEFEPLTEAQAAAKTDGRLPGFRPFPDDTPGHREANQRQGEEILRFVLKASGGAGVIAEDLGLVPDYVPATLRKLGLPGFRIPSFSHEHEHAYSDPAKYPRLSFTQPATHDHAPLAAAWAEHWRNIDAGHHVEEHRRELARIMHFARVSAHPVPRDFTDELHEAYLRRVAHANSRYVVAMITDVFGQTARFNTPGAASDENWTARMAQTVGELDQHPALRAKTESFARLMKEAGRGGK